VKTYTLTTRAYGLERGDTIKLDENDSGVRLNVAAGILTEDKKADAGPEVMTCPLCRDDLEMKRPPKLSSDQELADHYQDKHAGFAVPAWQPDSEE
jgi:hypothetical protein